MFKDAIDTLVMGIYFSCGLGFLTLFLVKIKYHRMHILNACFVGLCSALIMFIPMLVVSSYIIDLRYGEFHFQNGSQIHDARISIPMEATDIVVHKAYEYHVMKFHVKKVDLDRWYYAYDDQNYSTKSAPEVLCKKGDDIWVFDRWGWIEPQEYYYYRGPVASNGGGFSISYDSKTEVAYLDCGYW